MWSKEDIDEWIDVLAHVVEEAYTDPEIVRTAPHNQAIRQLDADRPERSRRNWATTWRAHRAQAAAVGARRAASRPGLREGSDIAAAAGLLAGRVALVTGGSRGLGAAIAREFAAAARPARSSISRRVRRRRMDLARPPT